MAFKYPLHLPLILLIVSLCAILSVSSRECADLDIRNDVKNFKVLTNCTVVHGHLQMVLMDKETNDFTNISFPELREITGFLMVYRIFGLKDLGALFPNLTIIRGALLFADYALIIYDNPHLEFIGLKNLMSIERGFARVESCPNLCFASTIDWSQITHNESIGNVITKDPDHCPNITTPCRMCPFPGKCWSIANCQKKIGEEMTKRKTVFVKSGGEGDDSGPSVS